MKSECFLTLCCCQVTSVVFDSVRPHRQKPTRLPHPWDSPGKNTGVGCHFLLQCVKVNSEREVAQSCPTLSDPMNCSLPGSSLHGIFQARVLEWGAIAFFDNKRLLWTITGIPRWLRGKKSNCQCRSHRRHRFDPWVGKIPWGMKCNPLWYSCLEKSHGQRSLAGYSS